MATHVGTFGTASPSADSPPAPPVCSRRFHSASGSLTRPKASATNMMAVATFISASLMLGTSRRGAEIRLRREHQQRQQQHDSADDGPARNLRPTPQPSRNQRG